MDTIKVVCGIIYKDNQILLCRRKSNKVLPGYWEFPGGKVEQNENYEETLLRELSEELASERELSLTDLILTNVLKLRDKTS